MSEGQARSSRVRNWIRNVRKIVQGRQRWSAESEFAYYAVTPKSVAEHRARQEAFANEFWFTGMLIMRGMGILDAKLIQGAKILDIGAGECLLAGAMANCGAGEVWALDAVPKQLWAPAEKHAGRDNMKFVIASASDLPFGDNSFDLITANLVLHHIEPLAPLAREIFRCLRPGGRFVAAEPAPLLGTIVHEHTSANEAPIAPSKIVDELGGAGFVDASARYQWVRLGTSALGPLSPSYAVRGRKPGNAPTTWSLRRALEPMKLAGLSLDAGCAFAEQARAQERDILALRDA